MKHVAAYLLAQLGGNASPSAEDLTAIMASVGAEADADKVADLIGKTSVLHTHPTSFETL